MLSPKLARFLSEHPAASLALSNVLAEVSIGKTVQIYYFYSNDESAPKAHHHSYVGDASTLGIFVCENQQPCDECISILFEALNSKGDKRFGELIEKAQSRSISKQDFASELQRDEFEGVKMMKKVLNDFKLEPSVAEQSQSYGYFMHAPDTADEFLAYSEKVSKGQDRKLYEQMYDNIQKARPIPNR